MKIPGLAYRVSPPCSQCAKKAESVLCRYSPLSRDVYWHEVVRGVQTSSIGTCVLYLYRVYRTDTVTDAIWGRVHLDKSERRDNNGSCLILDKQQVSKVELFPGF